MPDDNLPRNLTASLFLDTPPEESLDRLTWLVSTFLNVPISLISVLDVDRQFFKSAVGLSDSLAKKRETPLSHSFCKHVVINRQPLVVNDAREHDLVKHNLAVPDYGVIAYAGVPITDDTGEPFAALCAIDSKPRIWTEEEMKLLGTLAAHVRNEVAVRERLQKLGVDLEELRHAESSRLNTRAGSPGLRTPVEALAENLRAIGEFGDLNEDQEQALQAAEENLSAITEIAGRS